MNHLISIKNFISNHIIKLLTCILSVPCVIYLGVGFYKAFIGTGDGYTRWKECAYVLHHINPLDVSMGIISPLEAIGSIRHDATTVPWSYLMCNLFYPGMLPWNTARIIFIILVSVLLLAAALLLFANTSDQSTWERFFLIAILFSGCGWYSALGKLNPGICVCICLILIVMICQYHKASPAADFIISILLAISMLKPQIALLFYIPLFCQKRIRPIVLSGVYLIFSWAITCFMCKTAPLDILTAQFQIGAELNSISEYVYYGILDFLLSYGFSTISVLFIEMLAFSVIGLLLGYRLKSESIWMQFSVPAFFTILWCYHHNMDFAIVNIMMISIGFLLLNHAAALRPLEKFYCFFILLFNIIPITYSLYEVNPFIPVIQRFLYFIGFLILYKHKESLPGPQHG